MTRPNRPSTRSATIGLLSVASLLVVVFAVSQLTSDPLASSAPTTTRDFSAATTTTSATPGRESDSSTIGPFSEAGGWTRLGSADLDGGERALVVGADNRILVFGGVSDEGTVSATGAAFRSGRWTPMSPRDVALGARIVGAWTGRSLLVYGDDAAAYDPEADRWEELELPSIGSSGPPGLPIAAVDAGGALVVIAAGTGSAESETVAFSYGADTRCCRVFENAPFTLSFGDAVWTGEDVLVLGGQLGNATSAFAALDLVSGRWAILDPPPFGGGEDVAITDVDGSLFMWAHDRTFARWSRDDGWHSLPDVPFGADGCQRDLVPTSDGIVGIACDGVAMWSYVADRWITLVTPEPDTGWGGVCSGTSLATDPIALYVWCAEGAESALWKLDPTRFQASRFGERSDTTSPWEVLPNPAIDPLSDAGVVWTGADLLYLCGNSRFADCTGGWAYDIGDGTFQRLPLGAADGTGETLIWTGDELIGVRGITTSYDPSSLEWRTTQTTPTLGRSAKAAWTGTEIIFFGSDERASAGGVMYRLASDTWTKIPDAPIPPPVDPIVVWAGSEMYVFGGSTFGAEGAEPSQLGAAYEPLTNRWRLLPELPIDDVASLPGQRRLSGVVGDVVDGRFVIVGVDRDGVQREGSLVGEPLLAGFAYDPDADTWTEISPPDAPATDVTGLSGDLGAVAHGDELAVWFPGGDGAEGAIAFYRPGTDSWRYVAGAPIAPRAADLVSGESTNGERFVAYMARGSTVILHDR